MRTRNSHQRARLSGARVAAGLGLGMVDACPRALVSELMFWDSRTSGRGAGVRRDSLPRAPLPRQVLLEGARFALPATVRPSTAVVVLRGRSCDWHVPVVVAVAGSLHVFD